MAAWDEAQDAKLRALWAAREDGQPVSAAEIGRRMGLTKNAVVGRAHRLGLPARPSPIHAGGPAHPLWKHGRDSRVAPAPAGKVTLPPPPAEPAWSALEERMLRQLALDGHGVAVVVAAIGRDLAAIGAKLRAMLSAEERADVDPALLGAEPARPLSRGEVIARLWLRHTLGGQRQPAPAVRTEPPEPMRARLAPSGTCCWPMWSNKERPGPEPRFCGAARVRGSYCAEHAARAYVAPHGHVAPMGVTKGWGRAA